eukprot:gene12095-16185_t
MNNIENSVGVADGSEVNLDNSTINTTESQQIVVTEDMNVENTASTSDHLRDPTERPIYKLSVKLIDTYKHINRVYYEAKAQRLREQQDSNRTGPHNDGYDDQNYDYILQGDEILNDRYILKHKMGKGSFGQVVCAYDREKKCEVAIKIIKSRKPFLVQAQTEIDILNKILEKDPNDDCNIVRLLDKFIYRSHQCLVFEILSFNLYELLKNTKFRGVSLGLIRKFCRQLLKSLELLSREDINIIHCDLKPENILLRNPRRSAIKLIDFGSSCYLKKRTYSYIQSRFYRSPEVLLGIPYNQKIDMWSLGCVAVEMHTGEPLFGGSNQADQICRIVDVLGMPPLEMIKASPEKTRTLFFEKIEVGSEATASSTCDMKHIVYEEDRMSFYVLKRPVKEMPRPRTISEILGVHSGGPSGRRLGETGHGEANYLEFLDFVEKLLVFDPTIRASASDILNHPYILNLDASEVLAVNTKANRNTTVNNDTADNNNNSNNNINNNNNNNNNITFQLPIPSNPIIANTSAGQIVSASSTDAMSVAQSAMDITQQPVYNSSYFADNESSNIDSSNYNTMNLDARIPTRTMSNKEKVSNSNTRSWDRNASVMSRKKRKDGAGVGHKMRSQSAPLGVTSSIELLPDDENDERPEKE